MKCIIFCGNNKSNWTSELNQKGSAYLVKLANKPLLEFYIDFCSLNGIKEIRIVSDTPDNELEKFVGEGDQWGVKTSFALGKQTDSISEIAEKNKNFISEDDLLVIKGMIFLNYDKNVNDYDFLKSELSSSISDKDGDGVFLIKYSGDKPSSVKFKPIEPSDDFSISKLQSIKDFYTISLDLIKSRSDSYVLPGYCKDDSVFIGQNVGITKYASIEKPLSLGQGARIVDAQIGPAAIVGCNSIIEKNSSVRNAIVYDNTYVGSGLEIENKIIVRKTIIDPESGESLEVPDDYIISNVKRSPVTLKLEKLFFWFIALALWCTQLIPFLVLKKFVNISEIEERVILDRDRTEFLLLKAVQQETPSFLTNIFFRLSLDKFYLLLESLKFKIYLAGNTAIRENDENAEIIADMSVYRPAVFTINNMLHADKLTDIEKSINELYYSNNSSFLLNLKIIFRSILIRLFLG